MEEGRTKLVDIKAAHYVLTNELNMHSRNQSSTLGPRPSQNREIKVRSEARINVKLRLFNLTCT